MAEFHNEGERRRRRVVPAFRPVEPLEGRLLFATTPNDPNYNVGLHLSTINAPLAWDTTTGSSDVIVAVLDTGVDITHPDLLPNIWANPGEVASNGVDDDGNGFIDDTTGWDFDGNDNTPTDADGHGTHVAGIIGAVGNNATGVTGVAWNVKILPVKVLDDFGGGNTAAVAAGIEYVAGLRRAGHNVVAMNLSLGFSRILLPADMERAVRLAQDAGVLVVTAAGNDAADNDPIYDWPSKFALQFDNVINVAATDQNDELAEFTVGGSNFGFASVHVAAPGKDILSLAPGLGYVLSSGTSMASPVVAGIAALAGSAFPNASYREIREAIFNGVEPIESFRRSPVFNPVVSTGGRVNAYNTLRAMENRLAGVDHSTHANYAGKYGLQGSLAAPPAGVAVNVIGGDVQVGGPAGTFRRSVDPITVDLNFTDGQPHRVSLVMLGVDHFPRQQVVDLYDAATGLKIGPTQVATMRGEQGTILTYDLSGAVRLVVSRAPGNDSVVLHDVTFDEAATDTSTFAGADRDTQGRWRRRYGSEGAVVVGHHTSIPFASVTGATTEIVKAKTKKPEALELPGNNTRVRTVGYLKSATSMTIDADLTARGGTHRLTVYAVDFDRQARGQMFELRDGTTGTLLDRRVLEDFAGGAYLTWEVTGHVQLVVTRITGPDAVVSGLFLDAAATEPVRYVGQDDTTGGDWISDYGSVGAYIISNHEQNLHDQLPAIPAGVGIAFPDSTVRVVDDSSPRRGAVRKYDTTRDRIAAQREAFSTVTVNLDVDRELPLRVSLYMADVQNRKRAQLVRVLDAGTGAELARTEVVGFRDGVYVTFDISTDVVIKIDNLAGPGRGAIVNAAFFD